MLLTKKASSYQAQLGSTRCRCAAAAHPPSSRHQYAVTQTWRPCLTTSKKETRRTVKCLDKTLILQYYNGEGPCLFNYLTIDK